MQQPIAIQSWCYREFKSLPSLIEQLKATGVSATELCGIHADFNKAETYASVIDTFKKASVQIVAIGVIMAATWRKCGRRRRAGGKSTAVAHPDYAFAVTVTCTRSASARSSGAIFAMADLLRPFDRDRSTTSHEASGVAPAEPATPPNAVGPHR